MTSPLIELVVVGLVAGTMVVSWFGLIIPIYPGLNVIWLAALGWGLYSGFAWPAWLIFTFMSLLMIAGNLMDNIFISGKARLTGASWWSILAGNLLGILGAFLLPPLGGLLFAVLGVLIVEYIRHRDWKKAFLISKEMFFGFGWAILGRMGFGAVMILLWILWAYQIV